MSKDLNRWIGIGRLVRDAELKYISTGTALCKFSIACNDRIKKGDQWEDDTSFLEIVLWGKTGEALTKYLVKGKTVGVEGRIKMDTWESEGQKRSKLYIVADEVQLLGSFNKDSSAIPNSSKPSGSPAKNLGLDGFVDDILGEGDSGIPF
ncbi:MAG: single-stranded DNA-binding protein [Candidatus Nanoarchaeia archaeon]|nr:single-stranded DNA-binding protein [Candidatus Nanoarchaeia archaeon]